MDHRAVFNRIRSNPDVVACLFLGAAGVLFFADFLFTSKNFYYRDILTFHYPLRKLLIEAYSEWRFPLWNPYTYLGQPMLANLNFMAFYPTNLFHFFAPFDYAFKLHFVIHALLAAPGMYLLERKLGIRPAAAFGGALIYGFSGPALSFLNLYNIVPVVALMPWIAWAFMRALDGCKTRAVLIFGGLVALQVLAFEPIMVQCELLLLTSLSLLYIAENSDRWAAVKRVLGVAMCAGLFAAGLCAVQILPTLELMPLSIRGAGMRFADLSLWSLHPADLINVIIPGFFGNPYTINRALYWGEAYHDGREGYLISFFFGTAAVLLAMISFTSRRQRLQRTFLALAVAGTALALGRFNPLHEWLCTLPGFDVGRYPAKYFLVTAVALSILAALGLDSLYSREGERRKLLFIAASSALILGAFFLGLSVYWQVHPQRVLAFVARDMDPGLYMKKDFEAIVRQLPASMRWSGLFALMAGAMLLLRLRRSALPIGPLMTLLAAAELMPPGLGLSPLMSQADLEYTPKVNQYLQSLVQVAPKRVISLDPMDRLPIKEFRAPNSSVAWFTILYRDAGMPMFGVMNRIQYSLYPSIDELNTRDSDRLLEAFRKLEPRSALMLLQKLNTPYLLTLGEISDPRVRLVETFDTHSDLQLKAWELTDAQPRAYFVAGVQSADSHEDALKKMLRPEFRFDRAIVLENAEARECPGEAGQGTARIADYRTDFVRCEVDAARPGYLALLDSYYPGWEASVDGKPVPILRANYAFRAVEVPQGRHRVEFRYRPRSFYAGLTMSGLTLLAAACVCFIRRR